MLCIQEELAQLAASWPSNRLIDVWNSLSGVVPVKRFKDRQPASGRIWAVLAPTTLSANRVPRTRRRPPGRPRRRPRGGKPATAREGGKKGKASKATSAKKADPMRQRSKKAGGKEAREVSKKAEVLELMRRAKAPPSPRS